MAAGIRTRHARSCRSRDGGRCNCSPSYEAWVYSKRDDKKIRKTFKSLAEAKGWRADAEAGVRARTLRGTVEGHARRSRGRVDRGREEGDHPQRVGRRVQAEHYPRLRRRSPPARARRSRRPAALRHNEGRPPGFRRPASRPRPQSEHDQRDARVHAGDLLPRSRARAGALEPHLGCEAALAQRPARADRRSH